MEKELVIDLIIKVVCEFFDIEPDMIHKITRKREIVKCRQIAQSLSYSVLYPKASLKFIGENIGEKDHATVLYSKKNRKKPLRY